MLNISFQNGVLALQKKSLFKQSKSDVKLFIRRKKEEKKEKERNKEEKSVSNAIYICETTFIEI